ncbi:unnamed protein product [Darwinula stevensoni]|uniref:C-type lectin domain-containing protein n=1 Tax=Darwinula stevensoni TaxID=69355 RepID=A0A7R8X9F2_9CRUS|nr:unnamed protein product [Darwinula stevensoni]CAG0885528.1 unnamed protein product [Darwinula stevensoni]
MKCRRSEHCRSAPVLMCSPYSFVIFILILQFPNLLSGGIRQRSRIRDVPVIWHRCPKDFVYLGHSCYLFSQEIATWNDAHFQCMKNNASLVTPASRWENHILRQYLLRPEFAPLSRWIDAFYNWNEKMWMWSSSGHLIYNPDFGETQRHWDAWTCGVMSSDDRFHWLGKSCFLQFHYICESLPSLA